MPRTTHHNNEILSWDNTSPGNWETQRNDGSIWNWHCNSGSVSERTNLHPRNPILSASSLQSAHDQIADYIERIA
jgi:hypothetical protein